MATEWTVLMLSRAAEVFARLRCSPLLASGPLRSTMDLVQVRWGGEVESLDKLIFNSLCRKGGCGGETVSADGLSEK